MNKLLGRLLRKVVMLVGALCALTSRLFVLERVRGARWIRKKLLACSGVKFEPGDFFGDSGLRILFPSRLHIGKNVSLGHDNHFWCFSDVRVGAWTQTAKGLLVIAGSHENSSFRSLAGEDQQVTIGPGCWIGARVTILGGTNLGAGCIVAAGAVVKGDFPALSIVGGVPARTLKQREPAAVITSPFGEYLASEILDI